MRFVGGGGAAERFDAAPPAAPVGQVLTPQQRRTIASLLPEAGRTGPAGSAFEVSGAGPAEHLRTWLEAQAGAMATALPGPPLRLSKERLTRLERCQGLFDADVAGERPPFVHSRRSAAGTLLHRALELEAGATAPVDPSSLLDLAVQRLGRDRAFGAFWRQRTDAERADVRADAARAVDLFRASFPSLPAFRRRLAPTAELWLETPLAGGRILLCGRVDLIVGQGGPGRGAGGPSGRVLIDLKTGSAWPEHAEDMRFYALLFTLRVGVPPARVATMFLRSGECQVEAVSPEALQRAAERVVAAVRAAARLAADVGPDLTPGPHCRWCPRRATCPGAAPATAGEASEEEG